MQTDDTHQTLVGRFGISGSPMFAADGTTKVPPPTCVRHLGLPCWERSVMLKYQLRNFFQDTSHTTAHSISFKSKSE